MDVPFMIESIPKLLMSVPYTLAITFVSLFFGLLLGLSFTACKLSRYRPLRKFVTGLTVVIRGIPIIVLLFLSYFGLPGLFALFGVDIMSWHRAVFVVIALVVDISASSSELFRSAYLSLDPGQIDAAHSIGMNRVQLMFRVIVPQALQVCIPNIGNTLIGQIHNTSLVYTLGVIDIIGRLRMINSATYNSRTLELYVDAFLIYWVVCILFEFIFRYLEKWLSKGVAPVHNG